jgi:hypothetical protein
VVADNYIEAFARNFAPWPDGRGPRDFYDVVKLYRNIDVRKEPSGVR